MQGTMLRAGTDFVSAMAVLKPYWFTRTLAGATMDLGAVLGMWNFYRTVTLREPIAAAGRVPIGAYPEPKLT